MECWYVSLLSTIFGFPERNSVSSCFGHTLIGISSQEPLTSIRTLLCSAFQLIINIFATTYSDLSQLTSILLLQTLLPSIWGVFSTGSTCIFASRSQCVLELSLNWAPARAHLLVSSPSYWTHTNPNPTLVLAPLSARRGLGFDTCPITWWTEE